MARYRELMEQYDCIGDVRGLGGMVGIEFVTDRASKTPDAALTSAMIQACAKRGLLVENAGTYGNVIRLLAPIVMTCLLYTSGAAEGVSSMRKVLMSDCIMAACPESSSLAAALSSAVAELVCTTEET